MAEVKLTVFGPLEAHEVAPDADGTTLGRSNGCHVQLDSRDVSREHARIFKDPFDRWIVEDLGSSNGTFIAGRRIESSPIVAGQPIAMGPYSVILSEQQVENSVEADEDDEAPANIVVEDFETEFFYGQGQETPQADAWPDRLADVRTRLDGLSTVSALYHELCRSLACSPKAVAAILRIAGKGKPIAKSPNVVACDFGSIYESPETDAGIYPSPLAFRISHRVLEHVRDSSEPVMAKSIYSSDIEVTMAVVDEHSPRAVICTTLGGAGEDIDVLYLDIPIDASAGVSPERMFAFVKAVSEDIIPRRDQLIPLQLKAERSNLDHELSLARDIQMRFEPSVDDIPGRLRVGVLYKPALWVDGDYCDIWTLDSGSLAVAVAGIDAVGVKAAMLMPELRALLRTAMRYAPDTEDALKQVHSYLCKDESHSISVGIFLAVIDPETSAMEYTSAAGPRPVLIVGEKMSPIGQDQGEPLGGERFSPEKGRLELHTGAKVVICSDGVTDVKSGEGIPLGLQGLAQTLKKLASRDADHLPPAINEAIQHYRGQRAQLNDMTIVAVDVAD